MSRREVIRSVTALVGAVAAGLGVLVGMIVSITVGEVGAEPLALVLIGVFGVLVGLLVALGTRHFLLQRWPL
ncbi:hypothetical protein [Clavibacter zhangzhiyongii]|uniref:hypothetical protein n=1 Tax=Clavibacter TaxID=1573 RepID=UPI0039DF3BB7